MGKGHLKKNQSYEFKDEARSVGLTPCDSKLLKATSSRACKFSCTINDLEETFVWKNSEILYQIFTSLTEYYLRENYKTPVTDESYYLKRIEFCFDIILQNEKNEVYTWHSHLIDKDHCIFKYFMSCLQGSINHDFFLHGNPHNLNYSDRDEHCNITILFKSHCYEQIS